MTQALFTKRGLEAIGVDVEIAATDAPEARGFDIAHVFGVFDPELAGPQIAACKRAGVRVALSPIWWDLYDYFGRSRACERILAGPERRIERELEHLKTADARTLLKRRETQKYAARLAAQTALMRDADVLLPNSAIEAHAYRQRLRLHDRPTVVVPNPVDVPDAPASGPRAGIVCVARIEEKKNQAMLLYALRGLDADVTLIGGSHQSQYRELCDRWMTPRVRTIGNLSHEDVLRELHRAAVHVLPSWAETPGIANLEAAAAGARVIVSNDGTESEYFGELADYVDPLDPAGIRTAVERALVMPPREPDDALQRRLAAFSTSVVAERTLAGYRLALARRSD
jgi:glycosyltransferase involved in cell wall biosynthesis